MTEGAQVDYAFRPLILRFLLAVWTIAGAAFVEASCGNLNGSFLIVPDRPRCRLLVQSDSSPGRSIATEVETGSWGYIASVRPHSQSMSSAVSSGSS